MSMVGEDAKMPQYYYEIDFLDGRKIRRVYVSKKIAMAIYDAMSREMLLFDVRAVRYGVLS